MHSSFLRYGWLRTSHRAGCAAIAAFSLLTGCDGSNHQASSAANAAAIERSTPIAAVPHAPAWSVGDIRELQQRLSTALSDPTLQTSGIAVVDADGRPLFARRDHRPYAPASTFKVLAAISALQTFGPDYRFVTDVRAADDPVDGTIDGDVWLVGSGDPTLTSDDLRGGAAQIARSGVRAITGALVADASAFAGPEVNPAWDSDDLQYDFAAGTSALSVDEGTVEFHLVPGSAGAPAQIDVRPHGDAVNVIGSIVTGYSTDLSIDRAPNANQFTFSGHVAVGAEQSFYRPVAQMPIYAGRVMRSFLTQHGITVSDGVRTGVAPLGGRILWRHRSARLADIIRQMLFVSDNHYAEQLLRAVGAERGFGTERTGGAVERAILTRDGVPAVGLHIVDGSGLAPSNRIAPISLATLLARTAVQPIGSTFINDLPRVGIEGTVRHRDVTDALGRARAKSGHIENVNALTGFVQTRRHGRVAFAIMVNDVRADDGPVDGGIDRALDILATE